MADINRFVATGRLTADASVRTLASGKSVLTCNVAINTGYGEYKKTLFVKVQQWGDSVKNVSQYLKKGNLVGIDGELSRSEWTSKEGENAGKTYVDFVVDVRSIQMLGSRNGADKNTFAPSSIEDTVF